MKKKHDELDQLFERLDGQWDIYEPMEGHSEKFEYRLGKGRAANRRYHWLSAAASVMLLAGLFFFFKGHTPLAQPSGSLKFASRQTQETDSLFTAMIRTELDKVREKKNPLNKMIVEDALAQMKAFDADYEKIKQELARNGESRQLIYAMISNLQTRISFLEDVMKHLDNTEKLNNTTHENTI